jgi:cytoskeleton protein RodZ
MDATDAPATSTTPRSIGERLRAGRERAGLSVAATAEKLHLDTKVIEALEGDRFAELGASVYVRGHLRRYADFVGEPGADLVNQYTARAVEAPPPDLTQVPHAERRADPRRLVSPLIGLAGAMALALAIWWVLAGSNGGTATSPGEPAGSPQASAPAAQAPAPADAAAVRIADTVTPAPAAGAVPSVAQPAPSPEPVAEPPARDTELTLQLSSESWVEIYDSRGERLFYDVAGAGSVQSVTGRPPLRVVLGNAGAVAVEVDGQQREIPASAFSGDSARFVVNRSGSLSRSRQ